MMRPVADLEGFRREGGVEQIGFSLIPIYFNYIYEKSDKMLKTNPLWMDLNPPSRNPGFAPVGFQIRIGYGQLKCNL